MSAVAQEISPKVIVAPAAPTLGDQEQRIVLDAGSAIDTAKAFVIDGPEMRELAGTELATIKRKKHLIETTQDKLEEPYRAIKRVAEDGRKGVVALFSTALANLTQADGILTRACVSYDDAERKAREAAEAAARAERERLQREADAHAQRLRDEAAKLELQAREAAASGNSEQAIQLNAQAFEKSVIAEAVVEEMPTFAPTPVVQHATRVAGLGFAKKWKGRLIGITDAERDASKLKLIQFVATNPQFANLLDVNGSALNQLANSLRKAMNVDGAEAFEDVSSRRQS